MRYFSSKIRQTCNTNFTRNYLLDLLLWCSCFCDHPFCFNWKTALNWPQSFSHLITGYKRNIWELLSYRAINKKGDKTRNKNGDNVFETREKKKQVKSWIPEEITVRYNKGRCFDIFWHRSFIISGISKLETWKMHAEQGLATSCERYKLS